MAFTLKATGSIRRRLVRLVRRQLQLGEAHLREGRPSGVFEARKNLKKARAVVALLDEADVPSVRKDNDRLRDVGHVLAVLRDADAVVATFDTLRSHFRKRLPEHTYAMLRRSLVQAKARASREMKFGLTRAARSMRKVRAHAGHWRVPPIEARDLTKLIEPGFRASRKAMRRAQEEMTPADLHRWRRRLKTHWYQLRLLQGLQPSLSRRILEFKRLETWLGEDHNLSLLQAVIAKDDDVARRVPGAVSEISAMCAAEQARLRKKAFASGRRLLRAKAKASTHHLRHGL